MGWRLVPLITCQGGGGVVVEMVTSSRCDPKRYDANSLFSTFDTNDL